LHGVVFAILCPGALPAEGTVRSSACLAMESMMPSQIRSAIDFYDRHPISAQIILAKLEAARGTLEGLRPDDLFPYDQDHYGGVASNDMLAKCAGYGIVT